MYHIENIPCLKNFLNLIEIIELHLFFVSIFDFEKKLKIFYYSISISFNEHFFKTIIIF